MGKTVQNSGIPAKLLDCQTIVFLIQEKSCLLTVFYIHLIFYTIFHNFNQSRELFTNKALIWLHSLLLTYFHVTSLVNAAYPDTILCQNFLQKLHQHLFITVDSKCKGLHHQHIRKLIHNKARKKICLSEDHATA